MNKSSSSQHIIGQCVRSANEPELGLGHIVHLDAQIVGVIFPKAQEKRMYSLKSAPLERSTFSVGAEVLLRSGKTLKISNVNTRDGLCYYDTENGVVAENEIFAAKQNSHPLDALKDGRVSVHSAFELRKQTCLLLEEYQKSKLHGFIGSRVVLTPHQLYAVDKIVAMPYPRALLADEVGLGKTIEAALIFSKLKALGRAKKVLILVPEALKHQWLSELYRKFLELFTLVDEDRWEEELKSQESNSFASNAYVLASLDLLNKESSSLEAALKENWDLVIVDEAHQLITLEAEAPETLKFFWKLSESVKSLLFLTATPYRFGEENFELLMNLLKTSHDYPIAYIHNRRDIIQGFPQRLLLKYELKNQSPEAWLENFLSESPSEKILLLCKSEERATEIYKFLSEKTGYSSALFVESMDLLHRDKQAAWFASEEGARILVCSEMGSEGRNFQFCHDMILVDLPDNPDLLEQRIGRLDRIGQSEDVKIHVPYEKNSDLHFLLRLYEEVFGIFTKPCPFAFKVFDRIQELLPKDLSASWKKFRDKAVDIYEEEEKTYLKKVQKSVDDLSFNAQRAQEILHTIKRFEKSELSDVVFEGLMEHFGVSHDDFGLERTIKLGSESLMFVENFPHLGAFEEKAITFDRNIALLREDIEFLTLEHPLYQSTLDYFFGQESGLAGVSFTKDVPARSFALEAFFKQKESVFVDEKGQELIFSRKIELSKERKLSPQDAQKMFTMFGKQFKEVTDKALKIAAKKHKEVSLDSIHIYIGLG